jgi:hypothetical protein
VAVSEFEPVKKFEDWYSRYDLNERDDTVSNFNLSKCAERLRRQYERAKREMDIRVKNYDNLIKLVDAEVISEKPDLPNVSSGEVAGMIRRMARNLVQNTPNCEVVSKFDDDGAAGVFAKHVLTSRVIGDDLYSNDMQQNLYASAKTALTLGFDAVVPVLLQDAAGGWYMKYDNIYYRDVFPDPGVKDIKDAKVVFVRRYLTKADATALVRNQTMGWDHYALRTMIQTDPPARDRDSVDHQSSKHHAMPEGYEIITYYNSYGDAFLTFSERNGMLLRIEKNKDPLKRHPVFFLIMEKDANQPLGKSQVELVVGRQEFQDLMLNGAMKMWYRNINPPIIGYGTINAVPNLGPGKFTPISNPQAEIKPLEVSTQTLLQYNQIATGNAGNMVQLLGAADQQMAAQGTGGAMSQTPQGVEAQQAMVDITTNNYQKAIENFFSRYCSYALTVYFQELKGTVENVIPTADARRALINAGLTTQDVVDESGKVIAKRDFLEDGSLDIDFDELATEYFVRTIPGSLVEMEDEKQLRILQQIYVPLSQAMPALANSGNQQALQAATSAMQFIVQKTIELSGSAHSADLTNIFTNGPSDALVAQQNGQAQYEQLLSAMGGAQTEVMRTLAAQQAAQQEQLTMISQSLGALAGQLGIPEQASEAESVNLAV